MEEKVFYIYVYLDPRKPGKYTYDELGISFLYEPFYIGKGKGNRWKRGLRISDNKNSPIKRNKINKIYNEIGRKPLCNLLEENLYESNAFDTEIKYIKYIGRIDLGTGPLINLSDGGTGTSGHIMSEEQKKMVSVVHKGKKLSDEQKKLLKEACSLKLKGTKFTKERLEKHIISQGKRSLDSYHYWKGKKLSVEHKDKLSKASKDAYKKGTKKSIFQKGKKFSPEFKEKLKLGWKNSKFRREKIKKYIITNIETGVETRINNMIEFCKENKLDPSAMYKVASEKYKKYKNYTCREII